MSISKTIKKTSFYRSLSISGLVAELGSKWNQVKRELIAMWKIVNDVRKESPVNV